MALDRANERKRDSIMPEPPPRKDRPWIYVALAFLVAWFVFLTFFGPRRHARLENSGMSEPAPYDWPLKNLDDKPVSFADYRGKTVFLNIWATWCGPCRSEMPSIARLADDPRLAKQDIAFVCVATDDDVRMVKSFVDGECWPMTFLRADRLPPTFVTEGIPATFIIDPNGKIIATEVGAADWDEPQVVELLLKALKAGLTVPDR